jgi:multidrug efflux pump subunit AcrB
MKGIVGKFFYPFGITVAVAVLVSLFVSFTLDPMLSSIWRDPPGSPLLRVPVLGQLMRGTDRLLDGLHDIYERLIRWIFSPRRWRVLVPPLPAYGHPFAVDGKRDAAAPRRWRFATITPRAVVVLAGIGSFVLAIAIAPLVGTEFIPESDDSYIRLNITLPVGTSLGRGSDKLLQVEDAIRPMPEIRMISTSIGDTGSGLRNSATLSIQLVKPHERKRSQKEVEKAIRAALKPIPGIEVTLATSRSTSRCSAPTPTSSSARCCASLIASPRCPASPT